MHVLFQIATTLNYRIKRQKQGGYAKEREIELAVTEVKGKVMFRVESRIGLNREQDRAPGKGDKMQGGTDTTATWKSTTVEAS